MLIRLGNFRFRTSTRLSPCTFLLVMQITPQFNALLNLSISTMFSPPTVMLWRNSIFPCPPYLLRRSEIIFCVESAPSTSTLVIRISSSFRNRITAATSAVLLSPRLNGASSMPIMRIPRFILRMHP